LRAPGKPPPFAIELITPLDMVCYGYLVVGRSKMGRIWAFRMYF